jgi:acetyltransferase-like isoleucine patch superfamily enzyme
MTGKGLVQRYRRWKLARLGLRLDRSCFISGCVSVAPNANSFGPIKMGSNCELGFGVELNPWGGSIEIGHDVFLGPYVVIYGHGGVIIGDHTLISMHCCILSSDHTIPPRGTLIRSQPDVLKPTKIGRDVWLGAGVKVLGGVTIGDGCVVGAGAVVTKDLAPYSIAAGVPAQVFATRN